MRKERVHFSKTCFTSQHTHTHTHTLYCLPLYCSLPHYHHTPSSLPPGFPQIPPWLEEMIGYPTWRNLVYQLAEQFPDCLMLKFAIKVHTSLFLSIMPHPLSPFPAFCHHAPPSVTIPHSLSPCPALCHHAPPSVTMPRPLSPSAYLHLPSVGYH